MNTNNSLLLIDPNFEPRQEQNLHLLLKITDDSFSYAIIDKETNQLKAVFDKQECANVAETVAQSFKTDAYLSSNYSTVKAAIYTQNFAFIPTELFDNENIANYSTYLSKQNSGKLYVQPNPPLGFNEVFTLTDEIDSVLPQNTKRFSQTSTLFTLIKHIQGNALILDFTAKSFNALYIENQQVIFQNHYEIDNAEEFNYYLLLISNQLQLSAKTINIYIQGIIHEDDAYYNCIKKYFDSIYFFLPIEEKLNIEILDDMPKHYFSSLLALDICE